MYKILCQSASGKVVQKNLHTFWLKIIAKQNLSTRMLNGIFSIIFPKRKIIHMTLEVILIN